MGEIYYDVKYGERVKNWREGRDVTSKELYLDKYAINKIVCKYLAKKNLIPKDYEDTYKYDFWEKENMESSCCRGTYYGTTFMWYVDTSEVEDV